MTDSQFSFFDDIEEHKPIESTDWKWRMDTDYPKETNGIKVFSCFACGGGSTMGYKLAGCEMLGCCEIDPRMNKVYIENHHPKHNFLMDIRAFNELPKEKIPEELFNLDILDGSPPCTTFSVAGDREKTWGVEKKFREGQAAQTLDDLSFVFIDTVRKLSPKVVIMENVAGLLLGEAFSYVQRIYKELDSAGYATKHWLLKGEHMGVPQARHRVFFVSIRKDLGYDMEDLDMTFNYKPITYGEIKTEEEKIANGKMHDAIVNIRRNESISDAMQRIYGTNSGLTHRIARPENVYPTQTAGHADIWTVSGNHPSNMDVVHAQSFPEDYEFLTESPEYICGMSVPPIMIKRVVGKLIEQDVFKYKENR